MRVGGGKAKGSQWERDCGKAISLWLTHGERPDIMSRNVLSGGSFTNAENAGKVSSRMPGDMMAAHPLAFRFLSHFSIECKHLKSLNLDAYLFDPRMQTPFGHIITLARRQAQSINLQYMVIAKQNNREAVIFMEYSIGFHVLNNPKKTARTRLQPMYHGLHKDTVFMMRFKDFLAWTDPDLFLEALS